MNKEGVKGLCIYTVSIRVIVMLTCLFFIFRVNATVNYEQVSIGNPGNANDPLTGLGRVDYVYKIGKYEVTIGQYTEFLNAVASTDPYALYTTAMESALNVAGIARSGSSGSYTYSVINNQGSSAERPIGFVNWFDVARFANWMSNGQPITGVEDETTTEDGAYALNGATSGASVEKRAINPNTSASPTFYIPLENEWYKAAYYDGFGGYYRFATQSNEVPGNTVGSSPNQANFISDETGYPVTHSFAYSSVDNYLTNVGAFTSSASFYGTFDQTGSMWEWTTNEAGDFLSLPVHGGAYTSSPFVMVSSYSLYSVLGVLAPNVGMRLASRA